MRTVRFGISERVGATADAIGRLWENWPNLFLLCACGGVLGFQLRANEPLVLPLLDKAERSPLSKTQTPSEPANRQIDLPSLRSSNSSFPGRSLETRSHDIDPLLMLINVGRVSSRSVRLLDYTDTGCTGCTVVSFEACSYAPLTTPSAPTLSASLAKRRANGPMGVVLAGMPLASPGTPRPRRLHPCSSSPDPCPASLPTQFAFWTIFSHTCIDNTAMQPHFHIS